MNSDLPQTQYPEHINQMFLFSSPQLASGLDSIALAAAHVEGENFAGLEFGNSSDRKECNCKTQQKFITNSKLDESGVVDMAAVAKEEMLPPPPPPPSSNEIIIAVNNNDVLCGRGGETNHHPGNVQYRRQVKIHQRAYLHAKRRDKPRIARIIVDTIRRQSPPGRFLKKDTISGAWKDVGNIKAREKTSQALREGAPEIRDLLVVPSNSSDGLQNCKPSESQLFFSPAPRPCSRVVSDSSETASSHSSEEYDYDNLYHKTSEEQLQQKKIFAPVATKRKRSRKNNNELHKGPRLRIIKARMETQNKSCNTF